MSDLNAPPSLTRDQAILIASRIFAAYLLFWVVADITTLPHELNSTAHYLHESSQMGMTVVHALVYSYILRYYMLYLIANILRIALWLTAAGWFYRCGPRIQTFFAATPEAPPPSES